MFCRPTLSKVFLEIWLYLYKERESTKLNISLDSWDCIVRLNSHMCTFLLGMAGSIRVPNYRLVMQITDLIFLNRIIAFLYSGSVWRMNSMHKLTDQFLNVFKYLKFTNSGSCQIYLIFKRWYNILTLHLPQRCMVHLILPKKSVRGHKCQCMITNTRKIKSN